MKWLTKQDGATWVVHIMLALAITFLLWSGCQHDSRTVKPDGTITETHMSLDGNCTIGVIDSLGEMRNEPVVEEE